MAGSSECVNIFDTLLKSSPPPPTRQLGSNGLFRRLLVIILLLLLFPPHFPYAKHDDTSVYVFIRYNWKMPKISRIDFLSASPGLVGTSLIGDLELLTTISRPQTLVGLPSRYTYIIFFVSTPSIHNYNAIFILYSTYFHYCIVVIASARPLIINSTYLLLRYIFLQAT